jgi:hypothetical protein
MKRKWGNQKKSKKLPKVRGSKITHVVLNQEDELGATDKADELIRNFLIRYKMNRTLDSFQVSIYFPHFK